jgi:hypothetical protein
MVFSYTEPITQQKIDFTGVPMAIDKYTMRTEGVIVETLLGQAEALDEYARQLQQLEVRRRRAETIKLEQEAKRAEVVVTLAQAGGADAQKMIGTLLCPCGPTPVVAAPASAPVSTPTPAPAPSPNP